MRKTFIILGGAAVAGLVAFAYLRSGDESVTADSPQMSSVFQGGDNHGQHTETITGSSASTDERARAVEAKPRSTKARRRRKRAAGQISKNSKNNRAASAKASNQESTGLPSIYGKKVDPEKKNLYGVPIESWVSAQKNHLHAELPEPAPGNVRVYVQCMEVKEKGLESLNTKQCQQLRIKSSFDSIARIE